MLVGENNVVTLADSATSAGWRRGPFCRQEALVVRMLWLCVVCPYVEFYCFFFFSVKLSNGAFTLKSISEAKSLESASWGKIFYFHVRHWYFQYILIFGIFILKDNFHLNRNKSLISYLFLGTVPVHWWTGVCPLNHLISEMVSLSPVDRTDLLEAYDTRGSYTPK